MKARTILVAILFSMLASGFAVAVPAQAWINPNDPALDNAKFERFGPHTKGILIKLYENVEAEMTAMDNNELDFADSLLTTPWISKWSSDPRFALRKQSENGYFILSINRYDNATMPGGSPNPLYPNPCSVQSFRQALAWCVNRTYIINDVAKDLASPIWTPMPPYMSDYVHPEIKPGGALEDLTYGGMFSNVSMAAEILEANGFHLGSDGWRYWDRNDNDVEDPNEHVRLLFYVRLDDPERRSFAYDFKLKLTGAPVKIEVDYRTRTRAECSAEVTCLKRFHLYTGGWIFIGPDPDYLYSLFHSSMFWHPGYSPNFGDGHDPLLDTYCDDIYLAKSLEEARAATLLFQERFAELAWEIPLWTEEGLKVYRKTPVNEGGPNQWKDVVNQAGSGLDTWWTFLNLEQECNYYPDFYAIYGIGTSRIDWLNPIYAAWIYDFEVMDKIYDSCARRDPYYPGTWTPQLAKNWAIGTWLDPTTGRMKTKVTITLRSDLYWHDGVQVTTADLLYTFVESSADLIAKGLSPPTWYPVLQYIKSFSMIDPFNVEILIDEETEWAVGWIVGATIIPKHIWKPIIDASTPSNPIVNGHQPDPDLIGTGPYKFVEYVPDDHVILDANKRVAPTMTEGYYSYCPVQVELHAMSSFEYKHVISIPHPVATPPQPHQEFDIKVTLLNMWLNQCNGGQLIVDKTIYVDGELVASHIGLHLQTLSDGTIVPDEEQIPLNLTKCSHNITAVAQITGPAMLDAIHPNPWLGQSVSAGLRIWITIREDFCGLWLDPWHDPPEVSIPDCRVDMIDVSMAAKCFGTYPGHPRWNSVADVNSDYKIDIKDIAPIARMFGKW